MIYLQSYKNGTLKKRKGSTLVLVLLVFAILSVLLASTNILFNSNLKQAVRQEKLIRAHYLALSGIEAAKSTLLMPLTLFEGKDINMIEYIKLNPSLYSSFEDTVKVDDENVDIKVNYDAANENLYIISSVTLDNVFNKQIRLRLDVRSTKYTEYWD